eukprot:g14132.t1
MTDIAALQVGPTPRGRAQAAPPPPWSLMVPDARQGALSDAARAAERQTAQRAPASGEHDRPPTARIDAPFGADGFSFTDMLDVINPLQHLPIVSTIYRELTGDAISPGARVAGGTLYGGPVGLFAGAANAAMAESTGKDMGEHALAFLFGEEGAPGDPGTAIAAAPPGDDANAGGDEPQPDADARSVPGPQLAALGAPPAPAATPQASQTPQQTAFFRSLQQPKSHETPDGAAAGPTQATAGGDRPTAQQAALQAGRIRAHTGPGVPDGAPGGIAPTALLPAAPAAPAAPALSGGLSRSPGPTGPAPSSAHAPPPQAGGAAAGPTRLSPAAAQALMRLAEQSAAPPAPAPSEPAASARRAAAPGPTADAAAPTAAPTPQTPPLDQVPEAMMAALKKYEALKRGE